MTTETTLEITGMHCGSCAQRLGELVRVAGFDVGSEPA